MAKWEAAMYYMIIIFVCVCVWDTKDQPYTNTTLGCHTKVLSLICVNCRDVLVKSWSFLPGDDKVVSQGVGSFVPTKASNLQYFLLLTQAAFLQVASIEHLLCRFLKYNMVPPGSVILLIIDCRTDPT